MATLEGKIREVRLPSNIDPTLGIGYMALITQMHESNRVLREALGMPAVPKLQFKLESEPIQGK